MHPSSSHNNDFNKNDFKTIWHTHWGSREREYVKIDDDKVLIQVVAQSVFARAIAKVGKWLGIESWKDYGKNVIRERKFKDLSRDKLDQLRTEIPEKITQLNRSSQNQSKEKAATTLIETVDQLINNLQELQEYPSVPDPVKRQ